MVDDIAKSVARDLIGQILLSGLVVAAIFAIVALVLWRTRAVRRRQQALYHTAIATVTGYRQEGASYICLVTFVTTSGKKFSERVGNVKGTAENPMTHEEIVAKARDLITPVLGSDKCQKLIDRVFALEKVGNVRDLRPLLQRG